MEGRPEGEAVDRWDRHSWQKEQGVPSGPARGAGLVVPGAARRQTEKTRGWRWGSEREAGCSWEARVEFDQRSPFSCEMTPLWSTLCRGQELKQGDQ